MFFVYFFVLWMSDKGGTEDRPSGRRVEPARAIPDDTLPLDHHIEEVLAALRAVAESRVHIEREGSANEES
jgi:hypothetical protein